MEEKYLGDAVYIAPSTHVVGFVIFTSCGMGRQNEIYLVPEVAQVLVNWLWQCGIRGKECK